MGLNYLLLEEGIDKCYSPSPNSRGLIKKRGLAIFPEEINVEPFLYYIISYYIILYYIILYYNILYYIIFYCFCITFFVPYSRIIILFNF